MEAPENPYTVLLQITDTFEALKIEYVVVGSIASSIHGQYRASGDIDIVANLDFRHVELLVSALRSSFYVDDLAIRRAIADCRSFNAIHSEAIFKIDIFVPGTLGKQQLARREAYRLDAPHAQTIWIATAEDTILGKLPGTARATKPLIFSGVTSWGSLARSVAPSISNTFGAGQNASAY